MTMISFRVSESEAAEAQRRAKRLGVNRSELLRDALHSHLVRLASQDDAETWDQNPPTPDEESFSAVADWGPAEDWTDWADATG
ncbi:MAG TPA: ribbon-helix-helix domain-containing protein [Acidimicrobiales bacterium]|nr:ribbon-helix-helix domain-containing protein [Acidimicrobiales bacterium]HVB92905.1 ribbon-helix-helix domain-containing protein [Acidimicrobiales bacterium]